MYHNCAEENYQFCSLVFSLCASCESLTILNDTEECLYLLIKTGKEHASCSQIASLSLSAGIVCLCKHWHRHLATLPSACHICKLPGSQLRMSSVTQSNMPGCLCSDGLLVCVCVRGGVSGRLPALRRLCEGLSGLASPPSSPLAKGNHPHLCHKSWTPAETLSWIRTSNCPRIKQQQQQQHMGRITAPRGSGAPQRESE